MTAYWIFYAIAAAVIIWVIWRAITKVTAPAPRPTKPAVIKPLSTIDSSGIKIEILISGDGKKAKGGSTVTVNYEAWLTNNTKIDSSYDRGRPFSFKLGTAAVIFGWDEGMLGMQVGEKRRLTIPAKFGYGKEGRKGKVPPNSVLIFEVDMIGLK